MPDLADIDEIVRDARHWYDAAAAIRSLNSDNDPRLEAIQAALEYHFPTENGAETPFGPMWQMDGQSYPLPIMNFPDVGIQALVDGVAEVTSPLIRARLADILWVRKIEGAHRFARTACACYIALAQQSSEWMTIADSTVRSLDLATQLRDTSLMTDAVTNAFARLDAVIGSDDWAPGASLRIVARLIKMAKQQGLKEQISSALERCASRYQDDVHVISSVRDLQVSLFRDEPEKVSEFARLQVQTWINSASSRAGLLRQAGLEKARDIAVAAGLPLELEQIRRLIENSPVDESELHEMSATIEVPAEKIQEFEDWFFHGETMIQFLNRFGLHCPLPADHNDIENNVRTLMREQPLQFLVTRVLLNEEGLPIKYIRNEEAHFEHAVKGHQNMHCQVWVSLAGKVLERALDVFPQYIDDVREYFGTEFIGSEVVDVVLRAFRHFEQGRFDECVCVLLPRLEAIFRSMARSVGMSIYSEPSGAAPGSYKMLGNLLTQFEGRLPDNYRRYFYLALVDPVGINARNRLCHGLTLTATRQDAVLALHIATMLATLRHDTSSAPTPES